MSEFLDLQKKRRSIYGLGKNVSQSPAELNTLVKDAIENTPSAFNSQSVQAVVLTGAAHEKLWNITLDELKKVSANEEAFAQTKAKVDGAFKAGVGTVLYYTDKNIIQGLKDNAPLYAANFDDWSEQGVGIAAYAVWLTLAEAGIGASLQHYNPLIDAAVAEEFNLPSNWVLRGQMPFGSIEAPAGDKDYLAEDVRFRFFQD
ncbi:nitroreductase family protein [Fructobacillus ficulneus]|uniref:Nitroreductase family protein n=1 Tax=Fructobacillus ficulneus TaxID=157463 RepID=A0A0K8MG01_9LACO|nr:nitroreductase family protein [Fructobacillus ficulneus]GAO99128.1 nitroreductase family protein [Fructobacillus ficulneus]